MYIYCDVCVCICVKYSYPSVSATVIYVCDYSLVVLNNVYENKIESKNIKDFILL